jgi:hypothetical protein
MEAVERWRVRINNNPALLFNFYDTLNMHGETYAQLLLYYEQLY